MDAFDADVLIYAVEVGNPLGEAVAALFDSGEAVDRAVGVGSVLLMPEVLTKPLRDGAVDVLVALRQLLSQLDLREVTERVASLSVTLAAAYGLRAADAIHLATAVHTGADRFITNNRDDFPKSIAEVAVAYPDEL